MARLSKGTFSQRSFAQGTFSREFLKQRALGALGLKARRGPKSDRIPGAPASSASGAARGMFEFNKWNMDKALKDGYEINAWVFACVNAYAILAGSVPWRTSEFTDSEQKSLFAYEYEGVPPSQRNEFFKDAHKKRVRYLWGKEKKAMLQPRPGDKMAQLLQEPNPFTTRQEFMERISQHMLLGGNAMTAMIRGKVLGFPGRKTPFELWPLFPQHVEVERDGQVPTSYHYAPEGKNVNPKTEQDYAPEDIAHFRFTAPNDPIIGMSPLMAAARAVDTDVQSSKWNFDAVHNRAVPDLLISPGNDKEMSDAAYEKARRQIAEQAMAGARSNRSGGAPRAPWIAASNVQVQQMSLSPVEMDYIRSRGLNRQEICSIYRVFPAVIAVMEGVTLANMEAVLKHHWIQGMIPFMDRLQAVINMRITPEFGSNRYCWFDTSNVDALTENLIERFRTAKVIHTMGIPAKVINERLDLGMDLDDVLGADVGWFPAGVVSVENALKGDVGNEPGNPNTAPEGGDPGEPGDPQDPNEPAPDDVIPDDSPDSELSLSGGVELESRYLSNGNSDPHHGVKRWTLEEARQWLEHYGVKLLYEQELKSDNWWEFWWDSKATEPFEAEQAALAAGEEGGIDWEGGVFRFYHGEGVQKHKERIVERVESWGFKVT